MKPLTVAVICLLLFLCLTVAYWWNKEPRVVHPAVAHNAIVDTDYFESELPDRDSVYIVEYGLGRIDSCGRITMEYVQIPFYPIFEHSELTKENLTDTLNN